MLPSMSTADVPSRGQGSYRPVRDGGAAGALPCTMDTHTRKSASVGGGLAHEVVAEGICPGQQME